MSSYLPVKFAFFSKSRLIFNVFYCFCIFVNKHLQISGLHISERKWCYNVIPSVHCFYVKTKMLADFQICISVPLIAGNYKPKVVEKHFSEISKLSRAGARQIKPNRLMTEFCLQQHIILCYQI